MKTEVKTLWLTALRSGEYAQGSQRLRRTDDTFCCLGVLCDLAVKEGVIPAPIQESSDSSYQYGAGACSAFLPPEVAEWSGVDRFGQSYDDPAGVRDLAKMNDDGASFETIASIIEEHF